MKRVGYSDRLINGEADIFALLKKIIDFYINLCVKTNSCHLFMKKLSLFFFMPVLNLKILE